MWASVGIIVIVIIIMMIEVPPLLKKRLKKELWVFGILLLLGAGLNIAEGLHIDIPNPLDAIAIIYRLISYNIFDL
mgnify:CR=1 FL=1